MIEAFAGNSQQRKRTGETNTLNRNSFRALIYMYMWYSVPLLHSNIIPDNMPTNIRMGP